MLFELILIYTDFFFGLLIKLYIIPSKKIKLYIISVNK